MTRQEIIAELRNVMKKSSIENANWDSVQGSDTIQTLGFDSLSILDLVYDIQQAFKVDFNAEELVGVKTVDDLAAFLEKQMG